MREVAADDPTIKHLKVVESMWTGRRKRNRSSSRSPSFGSSMLCARWWPTTRPSSISRWSSRCGPDDASATMTYGLAKKLNARCVARGDLHAKHYNVDSNQTMSPVVRTPSLNGIDAVAVLRARAAHGAIRRSRRLSPRCGDDEGADPPPSACHESFAHGTNAASRSTGSCLSPSTARRIAAPSGIGR